MTKMVEVLVEVIIFSSVIGVIATQVANPNENITGSALTMYVLITLFVVIGFIVALLKSLGVTRKR